VVINERLRRGQRLCSWETSSHANLNGRKRALTITGTAMSPEFIYTIGPGALMPDNEGYGILWMPQARDGGNLRHGGRLQTRCR
jgi:putative ABC transport system permease protein